jgi:HAD superfamily phosphoserine phosphatase-like hydrolase
MKIESADRIMERIDEARRAHAGGVLAFDGDGTLWSGDVGEDLFHAAIERGDLREEARVAMAREAEGAGLRADGTPLQLAERLYAEYLAGRFSEERMCELMTWAFAGWTREAVDAFAEQTIDACALGPRMHKEALRIVEWARGAGIDVFVVSASPRAIVERAVRRAGVPADRVVAATPLYEKDRMLADVARPIPYGDGKVKNLRVCLGDSRPLYAAFGDNAFDVSLLSEAFIPVAVRPKPRLRERAHEVKSLVEIQAESP